MESIEVKLFLFTSQLGKVQAFYTAVGMNWNGGPDPRIDECFRPDSERDDMGFPFLTGDLGNVEFNFFFRESVTASALSGTDIVVCFPQLDGSSRAVERLKAAGLFVPGPGFDQYNCILLDPDGRTIALGDPSPFNI
jgi:hypothetical protein